MVKTYILSTIVAFFASFLFCLILIPILRKLKAGQNILVYVEEHKSKGGTPTMGGLAFVFAAILTAIILFHRVHKPFILAIAIGLAYMCVGLLDDFLKWRHKENLGLRAWQKLVFQLVIAIFVGIYCVKARLTTLYIPFTRFRLNIGFWMLPLAVFVFLATVNAVNLTDGLDGLAAGTSIPFFGTLGMLIVLQKGDGSLSIISFALVGALIAYLLFNTFPASVFMGDTGSLSLGGFAACIALFSGNALYILTIGVCFVFSVISVLVQVIYYKVTGGKRVFLMAPVHHHFQKKGYSESKIAYGYFVTTLVLGAISLLTAI
ncbi:MAG: phospho-N-acetylmuramoyl-pentapeptide-transferase [Clostridia bacterium]|nr:phospho-N-acetylmuramoyl-pentapeptide-transferase [Clostridia bacterium]